MTSETPNPEAWKADYPADAADLEWWEAAFGKGNVAGWSYRTGASVRWAGKLRPVDPALRDWVMEARSLPAALNTVIAAVEKIKRRDPAIRWSNLLMNLHALRTEAGEER